MKSPLLVLALCLALGIAISRSELGDAAVPYLLALGSACLLCGLLCLRRMWLLPATLLLAFSFMSAGAAAGLLFEFRFSSQHVRHLESWGVDLNDPVRLEGRLVSTPQRTSYGLQFDVEVQSLASSGAEHTATGKARLRLQTTDDPEAAALADSLHLRYGDRIRALVRLRRPRIYQNPGSFDFRRWMEDIEDVYWVGSIKNPLLVEKLASSSLFSSGVFFERARHRLLEGIDKLYPPWSARGRYGAVLKAVLWGDRSSLDSETIENFRKTGLYHLLVIAGLHVGLLALLAGLVLRRMPLRETTRSVLLLAFLGGYALLVEQRAPTLRATLMIGIYLLARLFYRDHTALNAIGFAGLVLLFYRPAWLFESGFQLSFAAALLIAGLAIPILEGPTEPYRRALWNLENEKLDDRLSPKQAQFRIDLRDLIAWLRGHFSILERYPRLADGLVVAPTKLFFWGASMVIFSAVLQLGLMLPMAEVFHRVTYVGVGLNALAIPLMTVLLAIAVPTAVLGAIAPAMAAWLEKPLSMVMAALFFLTDLPRLPAWLSFRVPEPPAWMAWGLAISIVLTALALGRWRRTAWIAALTAGVFLGLISLAPFPSRVPRGGIELTALDCGQGDAVFVVLPDRTTMLVDAGGTRSVSTREGAFQGRRWDPGEDIVSPYLWSRGIKKVDVLVLSHAHEDHLGGLAAVVENFEIGEFWHGPDAATPEYESLKAQILKRRIPERVLLAGTVINRGGAIAQFLWPPAERTPSQFPSNDDSLVMRVSYGESSVLLPGDISSQVEDELLASGLPLRSQILKVAHHGSKSSSTPRFVARVQPQAAIVTGESGGLGNLPNPLVLDILRASGAQIFRTDLDGAVTAELRTGAVTIRRYGALAGLSTRDVAEDAGSGAGGRQVP